MSAPPERVFLLDVGRETTRRDTPASVPAPGEATPQEGLAQGASRGRAPAPQPTVDCILHTAHHLPGSAECGVQGVHGVQDRGRRGSDALPQGKFLPLGATLSCGGRPGSGVLRATQTTADPSPVTLTTRSHRHRSPPGTDSGNARAPPRLSCSAPAGRTWASPETSSSGGRGARRWP